MEQALPMYDGAVPQVARQEFVRVGQLPHVQGMGEVIDRAVNAGLGAAQQYARLRDFGEQQKVEHAYRVNEVEMRKAMERGLGAKWGTKESFFNADGSRNEDNIAAFKSRWQEANMGVERDFKLRETAMRDAARLGELNDDLAASVELGTERHAFENRRRSFEANYELAVEQGDLSGARDVLDEAVAVGQILPAEAARRKVKLKAVELKRAGAERGSVLINGQEFSGASAALAVAREVGSAKLEGGSTKDEVQGAADKVQGRKGEEERRVWGWLPVGAVVDFAEAMDDGLRVLEVVDDGGGVRYGCQGWAPDVVRRVAARATENKELTRDDAMEVLVRVTLDSAHANRAATTEQLLKQFDNAGIYEVLGDGDAAVGQVAARAVVEEWRSRAQTGTNKLGLPVIARMVKEHAQKVALERAGDWQMVKDLDPGLDDADDEWELDDVEDDAQELARWKSLMYYYTLHRREFGEAAGLEVTAADFEKLSYKAKADEFEDYAQRFYDWFRDMKGGESEARLQKDYVAAIEDFYMTQVTQQLLGRVDLRQGELNYSAEKDGYASDVEVVRDVLNDDKWQLSGGAAVLPQLEKLREEAEKADAGRAKEFRRNTAQYYERLRGLKAQKVQQDKVAEAEAKRLSREAEKAARDEEKRLEREAERRLRVERAKPRECRWSWDGAQAADGEAPACSLPAAQFKVLVEELGFDGAEVPYIVVGGKRVLVTDTHEGDEVKLNTPAVMLLQDKAARGKQKELRVQGDLGFKYYFGNF